MSRPDVGIVHLGIGAFFRAFALPYLEDAMAEAGGDWGVLGVSLRSADVRDRLVAQDCVYHAMELSAEGRSARRIEALRDVLFAGDQREAVLGAMCDPGVSIVSLTVTEKGYCHAPATGRLDAGHYGIVADLASPHAPATAPGVLVEALARRRSAGTRPFTCLSCDNLPGNGGVLRSVVLDLARRRDPALANWIAAEGRFPSTMVDRIVPATTGADLRAIEELTGAPDAAVVVHEPFSQWVIEDDFVDGRRPALDRAGAQLVADVAPFEHMKLRSLNGTHSAIACLGVLAGLQTVAQATGDPVIRYFVEALWLHEIAPGFTPPRGEISLLYVAKLMERYRNPGIVHRTMQIAMDGSQKLPQRILATVRDNLAAGRKIERLGFVVAAWVRFLQGRSFAGERYSIDDPLANLLQGAALSEDPVAAVLGIEDVFAPDLAGDLRFQDAVRHGFDLLRAGSVQDAIKGLATCMDHRS